MTLPHSSAQNMENLDQLNEELDAILKANKVINPGLERLKRSRRYQEMTIDFRHAFRKQIGDFLESPVFAEIANAIGKAEPIYTDDDEMEIEDAVRENLKSIGDVVKDGVLLAFLLWVYNEGGQDFFDKQGIPRTFQLRDQQIIARIQGGTVTTFKGVDETTTRWLRDQIMRGKVEGMAYNDIADSIRNKVPDTYSARAEAIVRTETSNMVGEAEYETANKNGASHKFSIVAGNPCPICVDNESAGVIGINEPFPSGDMTMPFHPNCECVVEYEFTPFMGTVWSGQ